MNDTVREIQIAGVAGSKCIAAMHEHMHACGTCDRLPQCLVRIFLVIMQQTCTFEAARAPSFLETFSDAMLGTLYKFS